MGLGSFDADLNIAKVGFCFAEKRRFRVGHLAGRGVSRADAWEKQIPCGNDRQKSKGNNKGKNSPKYCGIPPMSRSCGAMDGAPELL
jgi:hypothetical protein